MSRDLWPLAEQLLELQYSRVWVRSHKTKALTCCLALDSRNNVARMRSERLSCSCYMWYRVGEAQNWSHGATGGTVHCVAGCTCRHMYSTMGWYGNELASVIFDSPGRKCSYKLSLHLLGNDLMPGSDRILCWCVHVHMHCVTAGSEICRMVVYGTQGDATQEI